MQSPEITPMQRDESEILFRLLESVERESAQSHRRLAGDLNIALGLANAYIRRCIKRGLVKVRKTPARRYMYFLTPLGFAEKAKLSVEFLTTSFAFFHLAKVECETLLNMARSRGFSSVVLAGASDLAEIVGITALSGNIRIVSVVDPRSRLKMLMGVSVLSSIADVTEPFDAVILTDMKKPQDSYDRMAATVRPERILIPPMLGFAPNNRNSAKASHRFVGR